MEAAFLSTGQLAQGVKNIDFPEDFFFCVRFRLIQILSGIKVLTEEFPFMFGVQYVCVVSLFKDIFIGYRILG